MVQIDIRSFPAIKQICDDWCVLACIENVLKCNGENSYDQLDLYRLFPPSLGDPYFQKISDYFSKEINNFECRRENIQDINNLINFIQNKISQNIHVILSTQSGQKAHAIIIIGFDDNSLKYFNPAKNTENFLRIQYSNLIMLLGSHRDMLIIKRKT